MLRFLVCKPAKGGRVDVLAMCNPCNARIDHDHTNSHLLPLPPAFPVPALSSHGVCVQTFVSPDPADARGRIPRPLTERQGSVLVPKFSVITFRFGRYFFCTSLVFDITTLAF